MCHCGLQQQCLSGRVGFCRLDSSFQQWLKCFRVHLSSPINCLEKVFFVEGNRQQSACLFHGANNNTTSEGEKKTLSGEETFFRSLLRLKVKKDLCRTSVTTKYKNKSFFYKELELPLQTSTSLLNCRLGYFHWFKQLFTQQCIDRSLLDALGKNNKCANLIHSQHSDSSWVL